MTMLQNGWSTVQFLAGTRYFLSYKICRLTMSTLDHLFSGYWGSLPAKKQLRCKADHLPPRSSNGKNQWSNIATPPYLKGRHVYEWLYLCLLCYISNSV